MTASLYDLQGRRKYLIEKERFAFVRTARCVGGEIGSFCLVLAFTGARISEVLALTRDRIDSGNGAIVVETLKRRHRSVFRAVPVPSRLVAILADVHKLDDQSIAGETRLWPWCRTTAWKHTKHLMLAAGVCEELAMPKSARHAFAVGAVQHTVSLNIIQRWMGHARIETTAIYANAIGPEERALAQRAWRHLEAGL